MFIINISKNKRIFATILTLSLVSGQLNAFSLSLGSIFGWLTSSQQINDSTKTSISKSAKVVIGAVFVTVIVISAIWWLKKPKNFVEACKKNNLKSIKCLVENGADINASVKDLSNLNPKSPLYYACLCAGSNPEINNIETIKFLCENGAIFNGNEFKQIEQSCPEKIKQYINQVYNNKILSEESVIEGCGGLPKEANKKLDDLLNIIENTQEPAADKKQESKDIIRYVLFELKREIKASEKDEKHKKQDKKNFSELHEKIKSKNLLKNIFNEKEIKELEATKANL